MATKEDLQELIRECVALGEKQKPKEKIWITTKETMQLIGIKSRTTLARIKNEGLIEFTQPLKKVILFKKESVLDYLESKSKKTF